MSIPHVAPREQSTPTHSDPPCLETALALLELGLWPCLIHPPGIKRRGQQEPTKGKEPVGRNWGAVRKTEADLRDLVEWAECNEGFTPHGCGICLGPGRASDGGWLIDLEGDGPQAEESLLRLFGGKLIETYGWSSTRGNHALFTADGELLLKLLKAAGAAEGKRHDAGKFTLPDFPGLEFRIGRYGTDGKPLQFQSVAPPTPGTDGTPRVWNKVETIAELPEDAYEALKTIAEAVADKREERTAMQKADHVVCADRPPTGGNGVVKRRSGTEERAAKYLEAVDPAISGQGGHNTAFRVACIPVRLGITDPDTVYRLLLPWNERCLPPWSAADLRHKAEEACKLEKRRDLIDKGTYNNISQQADRKTAMYSNSNVITHNGHVNRLYQPNGDGQVSEEVDTRPEVIDQGRAAEADINATLA